MMTPSKNKIPNFSFLNHNNYLGKLKTTEFCTAKVWFWDLLFRLSNWKFECLFSDCRNSGKAFTRRNSNILVNKEFLFTKRCFFHFSNSGNLWRVKNKKDLTKSNHVFSSVLRRQTNFFPFFFSLLSIFELFLSFSCIILSRMTSFLASDVWVSSVFFFLRILHWETSKHKHSVWKPNNLPMVVNSNLEGIRKKFQPKKVPQIIIFLEDKRIFHTKKHLWPPSLRPSPTLVFDSSFLGASILIGH